MKKLLAILLAVVMLAQVVPAVFSQETANVTLTSTSAECGETVTITVAVSNCVEAKSIYIVPIYDEDALEIVSGKWLISGMLSDDWSPEFGDAAIAFAANTDINTDIFAFTFKVKDSAQVGKAANVSCEITIKTMDGKNEVPVSLTVTSGKVTVRCTHINKTEVPAKSPDCVNPGNKLYYTCPDCGLVFGADGITETTVEAETLAPLGHDWQAADCEAAKTCARCGATEGEALGHDFTVKAEDSEHLRTSASKCTEYNTYWYECARCGEISTTEYFTGTTAGDHAFTEKIEDEAHLVPGSGADCQSVKQYYYDCAYCDTVGTEVWNSTSYGEHKMATAWTTENGKHFHKCTLCDYKMDEAACSGGAATCTKKAVCSVCNVPYGDLAAHDYQTEWDQGDGTGHWHDCKNCTAHDMPVAHTPNISAATEEQAKVCTVCGYVIEPKLSHVHKTTKVEGHTATCTEAGQKTYYTCGCGKWFADAEGKTEITDKSSVALAALGHDWKAATCTAPKTCQRCGITEGAAIGHTESAWKSNQDQHWKACTADGCGVEIENSRGTHIDADKNGKCDICGHAVAVVDPSSPQTGDESQLLLWTILILASAVGIVLLVDKKKYLKQ